MPLATSSGVVSQDLPSTSVPLGNVTVMGSRGLAIESQLEYSIDDSLYAMRVLTSNGRFVLCLPFVKDLDPLLKVTRWGL